MATTNRRKRKKDKSRVREITISPGLWKRTGQRAKADHVYMSEVVRRALRGYLRTEPGDVLACMLQQAESQTRQLRQLAKGPIDVLAVTTQVRD
jgi:hypothetical protein